MITHKDILELLSYIDIDPEMVQILRAYVEQQERLDHFSHEDVAREAARALAAAARSEAYFGTTQDRFREVDIRIRDLETQITHLRQAQKKAG